jgi:hypothetical protein
MDSGMRLDVLIFGGGAAGLWCLDRFRSAGYTGLLLESRALGFGQTIQAQGIIHGGGKYALRSVRDFAAVRAIREMPGRWRECISGMCQPDLTGTKILSDRCYLWLPRGSPLARMQSWGFVPMLAKSGLLSTPPVKVAPPNWPAALADSALAVYALAEPVISTGTLLEKFLRRNQNYIRCYDSTALQFSAETVAVSGVRFAPRAMVFCAGTGNEALLRQAGITSELMQRRPLGMLLLKGPLPQLFGHCIVGGKTHLTVTTPAPGIWQVGGEIAERLADEENFAQARRIGMREIRRWIPGVDFSRIKIAFHRATRAEAQTSDQRRPSGVHASYVAPRTIAAWPTKLSLVPVLAEEVFQMATEQLKRPAANNEFDLDQWPQPAVAPYPWEEAEWFPAS